METLYSVSYTHLKENLLVKPSCHFFMGGLKINEKCETNVLGLYAVSYTHLDVYKRQISYET